MFALLALIAFVLALLQRTVGPVDLVVLGLVFVAAHLLLPWTPPLKRWRR